MTTYYWPILGGIAIGLSATLLLLAIGRIAGISGIVWGAIAKGTPDRLWRWVFLGGMILGTWLFHELSGRAYPSLNSNYLAAGLAGLLVGIGVKTGNGCTSGHGVCGIGRRSIRSVTATITFMLTAIITVFFMRTLVGAGAGL